MKILFIKGKEFLVDDEDFEKIKDIKWSVTSMGYACHYVYINKKSYIEPLHRFVKKLPQKKFSNIEIDHINGNKLDNRKENLRLCTRHQNLMNMGPRKTNTSGYKGVIFEKDRGVWIAKIQFNKKNYRKRLKTKEEAAIVYNEMAKKYFGEFAYLNIIK